MKRCATILLCLLLIVGVTTSQQTPSQILVSAAPFQALSSDQLEQSQTYLLSMLVYGAATSPGVILSNAASFQSMSYLQLEQAQTYLLSQLASGGALSGAYLTNNDSRAIVFPSGLTSTGNVFSTTRIFDVTPNYASLSVSPALFLGSDGVLFSSTNFQTPWLRTINAAGNNLTNAGTLIATNALGLITSNNAYIGGSLTIIGDIGTVQGLAVNGTATFTLGFNAAGTSNYFLGLINSDSNIVAATTISAQGWQTPTNLFSGTLFWIGTNTSISTAANIGFTGVANSPTGTRIGYGELTVKATGTVVVTNPLAWYASDGLTNRTLTNGNLGEMVMKVIPGFSTNFIFTQHWRP